MKNSWLASLYFGQGLPYNFISITLIFLLHAYGWSNASITLWTGLAILPWSFKIFFSPWLETLPSKKQAIVFLQIAEAFFIAFLAVIILCRSSSNALLLSSIFLLAFAGANYDVLADGYYMDVLSNEDQAKYVGWRSCFYQLARLTVVGLLVTLAGLLAKHAIIFHIWGGLFLVVSAILLALAYYHHRVLQITPSALAEQKMSLKIIFVEIRTIPKWISTLFFIFIFNMVIAQIMRIMPLFLMDAKSAGGLALSQTQVGYVLEIFGILALLFGSVMGGYWNKIYGVKRTLVYAALGVIILPLCLLALATIPALPRHMIILGILLIQFTIGAVASAYGGFLLVVVNSLKFRMTYYALATALMGLSFSLFGAISGYLQAMLHYSHYFILLIFLAMMILLYVIWLLKQREQV